jgi:hypothetical protein
MKLLTPLAGSSSVLSSLCHIRSGGTPISVAVKTTGELAHHNRFALENLTKWVCLSATQRGLRIQVVTTGNIRVRRICYYYYYYYLLQIEFSLGGSSPYTSNKQEKIYLKETIQKHSKCKYMYYQNTHTYTHPTFSSGAQTFSVHDATNVSAIFYDVPRSKKYLSLPFIK